LSGNWLLVFFIISNNNHFRRIRSWEIWINLWLSLSSSGVSLTSLLVVDLLEIFIWITVKVSNLSSLWSSWLGSFLWHDNLLFILVLNKERLLVTSNRSNNISRG
jgi:hypothetical protein